MAENKTVTEPATPATVAAVQEPKRRLDPRKKVYVFDKNTGQKLDDPVPETWLDGRFPQLSETPSTKAGK